MDLAGEWFNAGCQVAKDAQNQEQQTHLCPFQFTTVVITVQQERCRRTGATGNLSKNQLLASSIELECRVS